MALALVRVNAALQRNAISRALNIAFGYEAPTIERKMSARSKGMKNFRLLCVLGLVAGMGLVLIAQEPQAEAPRGPPRPRLVAEASRPLPLPLAHRRLVQEGIRALPLATADR